MFIIICKLYYVSYKQQQPPAHGRLLLFYIHLSRAVLRIYGVERVARGEGAVTGDIGNVAGLLKLEAPLTRGVVRIVRGVSQIHEIEVQLEILRLPQLVLHIAELPCDGGVVIPVRRAPARQPGAPVAQPLTQPVASVGAGREAER